MPNTARRARTAAARRAGDVVGDLGAAADAGIAEQISGTASIVATAS